MTDEQPRQKILIADDSSSERSVARAALESAGFSVCEASDGQRAIEVYASEQPDLVMLDVVMPRLTGLEACRILKAKAQGGYLPVIMVSSRNTVNARVEGLRSGADDYLGKPYEPDELVARVEALLRTKAVLAEPQPSGMSRTSMLTRDLEEAEARAPASRGASPGYRRRLEEEFDRAERYSDPLACLRVELDRYDDHARSLTSDGLSGLMLAMRDLIETCVRKIDLVFRVDERGYLLVLPNTYFPGALAVAERIVLGAPRLGGDALRCSVSVGVSFYPNKDTHGVADLLDLVAAALERARSEGGGRICLFQHQGYLYAPES